MDSVTAVHPHHALFNSPSLADRCCDEAPPCLSRIRVARTSSEAHGALRQDPTAVRVSGGFLQLDAVLSRSRPVRGVQSIRKCATWRRAIGRRRSLSSARTQLSKPFMRYRSALARLLLAFVCSLPCAGLALCSFASTLGAILAVSPCLSEHGNLASASHVYLYNIAAIFSNLLEQRKYVS